MNYAPDDILDTYKQNIANIGSQLNRYYEPRSQMVDGLRASNNWRFDAVIYDLLALIPAVQPKYLAYLEVGNEELEGHNFVRNKDGSVSYQRRIALPTGVVPLEKVIQAADWKETNIRYVGSSQIYLPVTGLGRAIRENGRLKIDPKDIVHKKMLQHPPVTLK